MNILALDTTSEPGGVAIRSNGELVAETILHSSQGFSHLIFDAIEQTLAKAKVRLKDIDRFAAASGPGSFTGVRVGLSAIKGLAEATGKQALGVSNLLALSSFGNLPLRAVVLDARRGEVYAAVYNSELKPVIPETVSKLEDWLAKLEQSAAYEFISPTRLPLEETRFEHMPFFEAPKNLAAAIAACAEKMTPSDPAALDANYVRRSDAELFWKDV